AFGWSEAAGQPGPGDPFELIDGKDVHPERPVRAGGGEARPLPADRDLPAPPGVSGQRRADPAGGHVPDPRGPVVAGRRDELPVAAEGHAVHLAGGGEPMEQSARWHRPERGAVLARRRDHGSVRAESDEGPDAGMRVDPQEPWLRGHVPYTEHGPAVEGGHELPVRAE